MADKPEAKARQNIDRLLEACGWKVQDRGQIDLTASRGVAIREFPLQGGDQADYLLYADEKVIGMVEAKKVGDTLTGVEAQTDKYSKGLADNIPGYVLGFGQRPLDRVSRYRKTRDSACLSSIRGDRI